NGPADARGERRVEREAVGRLEAESTARRRLDSADLVGVEGTGLRAHASGGAVAAIVRDGEDAREPPREVDGPAARGGGGRRPARDGPACVGPVDAPGALARILRAGVAIVAVRVCAAAPGDLPRRAAEVRAADLLRAGIAVVWAHRGLAEVARAVVAEVRRAGVAV